MKRSGILNGRLNEAVSRLGHGDVVVVADCGLPVPDGVPFVDLAVVHGVPRFTQVLDALLADAVFEGCVAAEEARSGPAAGWVTERFAEVGYVPHADLKALTASARLFLRTGEATAYANVVLRCGVPF
ncbi:D-ribose pyranase [Modestobacter sp. I12A-02628]|uniref:D-ribose pyranase n=1 Tax=Goekera deserti TaxID=2497753 RepID=A0A7K3WAM8_9ACTN|nr:D-ribose pyranase [Goekera deserti]MPR00451.1 D-ribose pyranase [Goekera deserti]NDI49152.1 D-ribose pyranase [Goekera deserti]NEL52890.1 D-ribose pyranase [Goekera deserti]